MRRRTLDSMGKRPKTPLSQWSDRKSDWVWKKFLLWAWHRISEAIVIWCVFPACFQCSNVNTTPSSTPSTKPSRRRSKQGSLFHSTLCVSRDVLSWAVCRCNTTKFNVVSTGFFSRVCCKGKSTTATIKVGRIPSCGGERDTRSSYVRSFVLDDEYDSEGFTEFAILMLCASVVFGNEH